MMNPENKSIVVIPVHKAKPTDYELISFCQCFKILSRHAIAVLAPENLDLSAYRNIYNNFDVVYIDPVWQSSLLNYNKLKLSGFFYELFSEYRYLLTYELDAFVFKDELDLWCNKGYDYIGAPWFEGWESSSSTKITGVGNSGFSLRSIPSLTAALNWFGYEDPIEFSRPVKLSFRNGIINLARNIYHHPGCLFSKRKTTGFIYEDYILTQVIARQLPQFSVAPINDAWKFSFEAMPDYLYTLNNNDLPMGCHAWWKYNFSFWKPFIEACGYKL